MNIIIQNIKSGFANIKELFGVMLSNDYNNEDYDLYINSSNPDISETAQLLKNIEDEQEKKRFDSFFTTRVKKESKKKSKSINNIKSTSLKNEISQNNISNGVLDIRQDNEPEKG